MTLFQQPPASSSSVWSAGQFEAASSYILSPLKMSFCCPERELAKAGSDVSPAVCVSGVVTTVQCPAAFSAADDDPCSLEDGITVVKCSIDTESRRHDKRDSGKKSHGGEASEASKSSHSGQFEFSAHEFQRRLDCPAAKVICSHCKKRGRFALMCRSKKRLGSVELHAVVAVAQNGRYIEGHVDGHPVVFRVDSGAGVSVVPRTFPGCPAELDKTRGE
ncbi:hypothetical protein MRX96_020489 [Rhipicephalus microplus]